MRISGCFLVFPRNIKSERWAEMSSNEKHIFFKKEKVSKRNLSSYV